jgi:hypothetical protein
MNRRHPKVTPIQPSVSHFWLLSIGDILVFPRDIHRFDELSVFLGVDNLGNRRDLDQKTRSMSAMD